jgi:hypothetical protein
LFDLAGAGLHPARIERLVDDVVTRSPSMLLRLHRLLEELAERGRPGSASTRSLPESRPPGTRVAASGLEARFERILAQSGVAGLERQVDIGGHGEAQRSARQRQCVGGEEAA